jgi:phenylacetic acid degradation operon negative regulatory protein
VIPPRALIVTVYGLYSRESAGWLPISGLVRLLAGLGVDSPAVRSATSRLKRRGLLVAARRDGVAGYALSETGREILAEGDEHIFAPPEGKLADGWLLAVFSVPEAERAKRHTLRTRLAALGFGTAAPGVWVAPAHRYEVTRAVLRRLDLESYVDLFTARYHGEVDTRWWDLAGVRLGYERFLDTWRHAPAAADPLRTWVAVVTDWRRLPYLDPGLPSELLPADWPGGEAAALLGTLRERWAGPAHTRARTLLRA